MTENPKIGGDIIGGVVVDMVYLKNLDITPSSTQLATILIPLQDVETELGGHLRPLGFLPGFLSFPVNPSFLGSYLE